MRGEITYLGLTTEFTQAEYSFRRDCRINGKPSTMVFFNGFNFTIPSNEVGQRFVEEVLRLNEQLNDPKQENPSETGFYKPFTIKIYDASGYTLRKIELIDAHIKFSRESFSAFQNSKKETETSMVMQMQVLSAIQRIDGKALNVFRWHISDYGIQEYKPPVNTTGESQQEKDLKFIAKFERLDSYKGEFGFDWMRDNYKDICEDYEKLKDEYFSNSIHEEEYFVPMVNMFPNQENVKLKLAIKKKEGAISDTDIIKLPAKNGIRFEPNEVKVSEADGKQITIICESALSSDVMIKLLDKNDKKVGVINVIKNDINYNLNIRIIKVVREQSKERDLTGINEALQQVNLENYLNKNSLNQALIKTNIENNNTNVIELNTEQLTKDKKLDGAGFKDKVEQVSSMFLEEYIQRYEQKSTFKGLLVFVTILRKPGTAGDGQLLIGDARNCSVFYDGRYQPTTYAHEIAHVLGCMHPFDKFNNKKIEKVDERIEYYDNEVKKREKKILEYEEKIKKANKSIIEMRKHTNNLVAIKNIKIHRGNIKRYKESIKRRIKNIEKAKEIISQKRERKIQLTQIKNENQHIFKKGSTKENFMDYTIPRSARISFWSWQWKAMQNDIKRYY